MHTILKTETSIIRLFDTKETSTAKEVTLLHYNYISGKVLKRICVESAAQ